MAIKASRMRSQQIMSRMSTAVATRKAYNEMNYAVYVAVTLSFYGLIVFLAMVLADIGTVFDFVSAYSVSCIAFIIPAVFYKNSVLKFGVDATDPDVKTRLHICHLFYVLGALNAILGISSAVLTLAGATSGGE